MVAGETAAEVGDLATPPTGIAQPLVLRRRSVPGGGVVEWALWRPLHPWHAATLQNTREMGGQESTGGRVWLHNQDDVMVVRAALALIESDLQAQGRWVDQAPAGGHDEAIAALLRRRPVVVDDMEAALEGRAQAVGN